MSTNDSPFSIFSSEAKKDKKSSDKVSIPETLVNNRQSKSKVEEMMDKMSVIQLSIDEKADHFSRQKGISKDRIWEYVSTSDNFTPEEWEIIRGKSKDLVKTVWDIVDGDMRSGYISGETSSRKGKYIGSRRNWIPTK